MGASPLVVISIFEMVAVCEGFRKKASSGVKSALGIVHTDELMDFVVGVVVGNLPIRGGECREAVVAIIGVNEASGIGLCDFVNLAGGGVAYVCGFSKRFVNADGAVEGVVCP